MPPSPRGEHLSRLPDDLVAGILSLLPPREVARARLVCRWWHALTTDHHFLRASSFSRRHAGHGHPVAGLFSNHIFRFTPTEYFPLSISADEEPTLETDSPLTSPLSPALALQIPGRCILDVLGSCNGLLLLWCRSIYYVWQPADKEARPNCPTERGPALALAFMSTLLRHGLGGMAIHSDQSAGLFQGHYVFRGCILEWFSSMDSGTLLAAALFAEMPGRDHFSRLPDDLVAGILALLPPRLVARARLVCQQWHSVTTDHHFLHASFSHGRPILGFFTGVTRDYFPLRIEADEEAAADPEAASDLLAPDLSFIPGTGSADAVRDSYKMRLYF
ncbi:hypothetical protein PR202_gn00895 [Eleusine coracana subsp. coracana]|uniref:F-box domain-containing protein n=1 Tax=Eleusine coracana subsp. coracana TaxID=191504 RepID=A0AAV5G4E4_ELECO|nr:hypothetical protein PR202_gn00895 [Eleusine coracana subsp. coracana]